MVACIMAGKKPAGTGARMPPAKTQSVKWTAHTHLIAQKGALQFHASDSSHISIHTCTVAGEHVSGETIVHFSRFRRGDFLSLHSDAGKQRRVAFAWHLTKGWRPGMGGELALPSFLARTSLNMVGGFGGLKMDATPSATHLQSAHPLRDAREHRCERARGLAHRGRRWRRAPCGDRMVHERREQLVNTLVITCNNQVSESTETQIKDLPVISDVGLSHPHVHARTHTHDSGIIAPCAQCSSQCV